MPQFFAAGWISLRMKALRAGMKSGLSKSVGEAKRTNPKY